METYKRPPPTGGGGVNSIVTSEDAVAPIEWMSPFCFDVIPGGGIPLLLSLFLVLFDVEDFFLLLVLPESAVLRTGLWCFALSPLFTRPFNVSLFPRRDPFPCDTTGPATKGVFPLRSRAATAASDPGDGRLLLLFAAGDASLGGVVLALSAQDPGGRAGGMLGIGESI
jgi:hypothetical protein